MITNIVPIKRIRSGVESLSYLVPKSWPNSLKPGIRVIIPFRSQRVVGLVWDYPKEQVAGQGQLELKVIEAIIDRSEVISSPLRIFYQWLSDYYLTPLPSLLAKILPEALVKAKNPQKLIKTNQLSGRQNLILVPYQPYPQLKSLSAKKGFFALDSKMSETEQFQFWQRVAAGEELTVIGTFLPLFLPWANLKRIVIFEPESERYKYEQSPKVNVAFAALKLANLLSAKIILKSYSPKLPLLENLSTNFDYQSKVSPAKWQIADASQEKALINFQSENWLTKRLAFGRKILIYHNFKSGDKADNPFSIPVITRELRKLYPEKLIASLTKESGQSFDLLKKAEIIVGTEKLLFLPEIIEADLFIPDIDFYLTRADFQPERLLAKINKLASLSQEIFIQTQDPQQPFLISLQDKQGEKFLDQFYQKKQASAAWPVGFWILLVFSHPDETVCQRETDQVAEQISQLNQDQVKVHGPSPANSQTSSKKFQYYLILKLKTDICPDKLRRFLLALPRPWKLDPQPINLI